MVEVRGTGRRRFNQVGILAGMLRNPGPVTADDVDQAVADAVLALSSRADRDWRVPAAGLDWDCWETVEHVADDLFAYALQLAPKRPALTGYLPVEAKAVRAGGPMSTVFGDPEAGTDGLVHVLDACGGLLSSLVRTAPPTVRGFHPAGVSDPEGFAAMGLVEVLVHLYDLAPVLEFTWAPDDDLCDRVLYRLFPDAPAASAASDGPGGWPTLLWAAGRTALPDHPRRSTWRWHGEPRQTP